MAFASIAFLYLVGLGILSAVLTVGGLYTVYRLDGGSLPFFRWLIMRGR